MALSVRIIRQGVDATGYYLQAEDMTEGYGRKVTTAPLPGNTVIQLDLGMSKPILRISGTADHSETAVADGGIANYRNLHNMNAWYANTIRLYVSATNYYTGKIAKIDLRRDPWASYWKFSIDFEASLVTFV